MNLKEDVVLVERADLAVLVVNGADRQTWLNGLVTCDLTKAVPERANYGLATSQKGRVLADVLVVIDPGALRVVVPAARRESLKAALEKYLVMEDVELELGADVVAIAHGPKWQTLAREGVTVVEYDELGFGGALVLAPSLDVLDAPRLDEQEWNALRVERGVPRFRRISHHGRRGRRDRLTDERRDQPGKRADRGPRHAEAREDRTGH